MSEMCLGCCQLHNSQYIDEIENNNISFSLSSLVSVTGTVDVTDVYFMPSTGYHLYLIGYNFLEKLQISYIQTYTSNRGYRVT